MWDGTNSVRRVTRREEKEEPNHTSVDPKTIVLSVLSHWCCPWICAACAVWKYEGRGNRGDSGGCNAIARKSRTGAGFVRFTVQVAFWLVSASRSTEKYER